jgi:hypothetical protein
MQVGPNPPHDQLFLPLSLLTLNQGLGPDLPETSFWSGWLISAAEPESVVIQNTKRRWKVSVPEKF